MLDESEGDCADQEVGKDLQFVADKVQPYQEMLDKLQISVATAQKRKLLTTIAEEYVRCLVKKLLEKNS